MKVRWPGWWNRAALLAAGGALAIVACGGRSVSSGDPEGAGEGASAADETGGSASGNGGRSGTTGAAPGMGASGGAVAIAGGGASAGSGGGTWCVGAGKAFRPGVTYSAACQTCTCQESGEWSCAGDACPTLECAALLDKYAVELANQRSCDPSLRVEQCQGMATTVLGCDCPTGVNDSATLYSLGQEFAGLGCVRPPCPVCDQVPRSSECVRGEAGDGTCVGFAIR